MDFIEPEDVDLMQDLLDGKSITAEVRTALCYGDLQNHDINDFWTLLLYTGYAEAYMDNETICSVYAYGLCFCKKTCSVAVQKLK